jgi:SAM-dependent methyltransferase
MKSKKIVMLCISILILAALPVMLKKERHRNHRAHKTVAQKVAPPIVTPPTETPSNAYVFADIYKRGEWGKDESGHGNSGTGSDPEIAKPYIEFLQSYLATHNIKSVVDLGCGDWRIGKSVNWDGIQYTGIDVVDSVVQANIEKFSAPNITFIVADGTNIELPSADLLICKEVLQHLPFQDIHQIVAQFGKFKHCIVVNDVDPATLTCENVDIPRGHCRSLDLTKPPFSVVGEKALTYIAPSEVREVKQVMTIQSTR